MRVSNILSIPVIAALCAIILPVFAADVVIPGVIPTDRQPTCCWQAGSAPIPNDQLITKKIWAPGLDDKYDPQGVTVAGGAVLLSSYNKVSKTSPCRVYRVDMQSGQQTGQFDMPADCGHAGGLAYAGRDKAGRDVLIVADTYRLYKIDMNVAFREGNTKNASLAVINLEKGRALRGSFVAFFGKSNSIFVGQYVPKNGDPNMAMGFFLPYALFETHNNLTINEKCANCGKITGTPLPRDAQGAAFDAQGFLWVTASSSQFGCLYQLDGNGHPIAAYNTVAGIEGISFNSHGKLWSVSEAGSYFYRKEYAPNSPWNTKFPLLFELDLSIKTPAPQACG